MNPLALSALGLLTLSPLFTSQEGSTAQEPETAVAPPVDEVTRVLDAFRILDSVAFRFSGDISRRQAEKDSDDGMMGGMVISFGGMDDEGAAFSGEFSGYRYDGGKDVVVLSKQRLPGFRAWLGKKRIVETLSAGETLNPKRSLHELGSLLDAGRLESFAKKTTWAGVTREDGTTQLKGTLDGKAIPAEEFGGMSFSWGDEVIRVETTLVVDEENWIQSASFEVVRNDPMASMGDFQVMAGGAVGGEDEDEEGDEEGDVVIDEFPAPRLIGGGMGGDSEPVDGEITTWNLKFEENAPPKDVVQFRESVAAHLDAKDL